jgi:hypothetical protein
MIARGLPDYTPTVAKHVATVQNRLGMIAVPVFPTLDRRQRRSLMSAGVPFIVPGIQLFIPSLAMDLQEQFLSPQKPSLKLSPTAQSIILLRLLEKKEWSGTTSSIAARLGVASMSVVRAFNELETLGFVEAGKRDRERFVVFKLAGRNLFDQCMPLFRNPVRTTRLLTTSAERLDFPLAGESALAALTNLAPPARPVFAVSSKEWPDWAFLVDDIENGEGTVVIETWCYNPVPLGGPKIVDHLSLFIQFHDHPDERIAMAAESLLENYSW